MTTPPGGAAGLPGKPDVSPAQPAAGDDPLTLNDVQQLMETLYGEADRARGIAATVAWLCEELGELAQAVRKGTPEQQLHELGDVLAWTASLANQLGLSLTEAMQRYRMAGND